MYLTSYKCTQRDKTMQQDLSGIKRFACLSVTGDFRAAPTAAYEVLLDTLLHSGGSS